MGEGHEGNRLIRDRRYLWKRKYKKILLSGIGSFKKLNPTACKSMEWLALIYMYLVTKFSGVVTNFFRRKIYHPADQHAFRLS